jgi:nucleotide-binding universal stress UspA family protein
MEPTRRPLLVAIGDTDEYSASLTYATQRALIEERELHLVHVVHPPQGLARADFMLLSSERAELAGGQLVHGAAERVEHLTRGAVPVSTSTPHGGVVSVLSELAADTAGVILQHRHRGRLAGALTGSVAIGVASRAPVPVTSVPEGWQPAEPESPRQERVSVAVGDRRSLAYLVPYALQVAAARKATLSVLHAWDIPTAYEAALVSPDEVREWSRREQTDLEGLVASWLHKYPEVKVDVQVMRGNTVRVLLDAYAFSDLLLVGRHRGHLHLRWLGSVARALVREAPGPVEVVPPADTDVSPAP